MKTADLKQIHAADGIEIALDEENGANTLVTLIEACLFLPTTLPKDFFE